MTERLFKTKLKAAELEALIMKRLREHEECAGIIQVYVRATGRHPPEEAWVHTLVSRRPSPRELFCTAST
jgi:hypothetical protein